MSSAAATSQLNESAASAHPEPTEATSSAATDGPITARPARENDSSALACCRWDRGARCGTMLSIAGIVNADTVPLAASMTTSIHTSARPEITSAAAAPWVTVESTFATTITVDRGNRSETTPPISRNTTIGTVRAASTTPSALAESATSSTANANAIGAIPVPAVETTRAE